MEPEILIVDEVLAVGDAEFQKAIGKIQDVTSEDSRTVLFVSHNMSSIRNLCERVIVLNNNGEIVFDGKTEKGINYYLKLNSSLSSSNFKNKYDLNQDIFVREVSLASNTNEIEYSTPRICFEFFIIFKSN